MANEIEYVTFKDFVTGLDTTENPTSNDKSVISNSTDGPRSTPGSSAALEEEASDSDFNDNSYFEMKTASKKKKVKASFIAKKNEVDYVSENYPRNKIIDRGVSTVNQIKMLESKQDGWSYELTDSGFLNNGETQVNAGEFVVWDSTNSIWVVVKPKMSIGNNDDVDFAVADDKGNVVLTVNDGDIETKNFNSSTAVKAVSVDNDTLVIEI